MRWTTAPECAIRRCNLFLRYSLKVRPNRQRSPRCLLLIWSWPNLENGRWEESKVIDATLRLMRLLEGLCGLARAFRSCPYTSTWGPQAKTGRPRFGLMLYLLLPLDIPTNLLTSGSSAGSIDSSVVRIVRC